MKAEEILLNKRTDKNSDLITVYQATEAMQEYTRDQIMQYRKRIKEAYYDCDGNYDSFNDLINKIPLISE